MFTFFLKLPCWSLVVLFPRNTDVRHNVLSSNPPSLLRLTDSGGGLREQRVNMMATTTTTSPPAERSGGAAPGAPPSTPATTADVVGMHHGDAVDQGAGSIAVGAPANVAVAAVSTAPVVAAEAAAATAWSVAPSAEGAASPSPAWTHVQREGHTTVPASTASNMVSEILTSKPARTSSHDADAANTGATALAAAVTVAADTTSTAAAAVTVAGAPLAAGTAVGTCHSREEPPGGGRVGDASGKGKARGVATTLCSGGSGGIVGSDGGCGAVKEETVAEKPPLSLSSWLREGPFVLSMSPGFFGFFAHVGALMALEDEGLLEQVSFATGASAGGLVAGLFAAGLSPESMGKTVVKFRRGDFWDPIGFGGLLRGKKFEDILRNTLPEGVRRFDQCRVPLAVSAFDVSRFRTRTLEEGCLAQALRATCTFPGLFAPVWHERGVLIDGGLRDTTGMWCVPEGRENCRRVLHVTFGDRDGWGVCVPPSRFPTASNTRPTPDGLEIVSLPLTGLPRPHPFAMERGSAALEAARSQVAEALNMPLLKGHEARHWITATKAAGQPLASTRHDSASSSGNGQQKEQAGARVATPVCSSGGSDNINTNSSSSSDGSNSFRKAEPGDSASAAACRVRGGAVSPGEDAVVAVRGRAMNVDTCCAPPARPAAASCGAALDGQRGGKVSVESAARSSFGEESGRGGAPTKPFLAAAAATAAPSTGNLMRKAPVGANDLIGAAAGLVTTGERLLEASSGEVAGADAGAALPASEAAMPGACVKRPRLSVVSSSYDSTGKGLSEGYMTATSAGDQGGSRVANDHPGGGLSVGEGADAILSAVSAKVLRKRQHSADGDGVGEHEDEDLSAGVSESAKRPKNSHVIET